MFIEKISIESFASLSDVSYDLEKGVNIFRGKNECGKSTLAAFIKFVFYGLCGKVPDKTMTEKTRYTNWDNGISGGNLIINDGGKRYCIERRLTPAAKAVGKEHVRIVDLESGAEVHKGKCPGEVFFGVSEEVFSQTAFSAQGSGSVVDSEKMNAAIDNILFSGNESVSVKRALNKLDDARVFLLHKNKKGGKIYTIDRELEELEARIAKAEENEAFLENKSRILAESRKQAEENRRLLTETSDRLSHYEAATVLARFEELDRKKEAYRKTLAEGSRLRAAHTVSDFLPGYSYRDELRKLDSEITIAENEYQSLAKQKDAFALTSLTPEQRKILSAIGEAGGKDKAKHAVTTLTAKRKNRVRTAVATTILACLAAILSVVLGVLQLVNTPAILYGMYGVTALFVILSVVIAASLSSLKVKELYRCYSADNEADALLNMDNAIQAEKAVMDENARYRTLAESLEACGANRNLLYEKAKNLLAKWGLAFPDRSAILKGAEKADRVIAELENAARAIQSAKLTYESAESALSGFSREEYEALKTRTAYVGPVSADTLDDIKRKRMFYSKKETALEEQIRAAELEIASRSAVTESTDELKDALGELETLREEYVDKYKAYVLAYEAIRQSGERLRARIAPALSKSASELMKESTKGRYADIGVDNAMSVSFRTGEAAPSREVGYMSAGTKALTYISLRLSLIRLLFKEKMPPTVFDEAFSWLDGDRLSSMMSLLNTYSESAQVIVMTCCDREYNACEDKSKINLIEIQ